MKEIHKHILELRRCGLTYAEISAQTGLVSSAISWIIKKYGVDIDNSVIYQNNARKNTAKSLKNMRKGADKYYKEKKEKATEHFLTLMKSYHDQGFVHYIAGLYDGEGCHSQRARTAVTLVNSDPRLIRAFIVFLKDVLKFTEDRIVLRLALHASQDADQCLKVWKDQVPFSGTISVAQYDNRPQKKTEQNKYRDYFGTVSVVAGKPNGLKEALELISCAKGRGSAYHD